jgi:hypothetical protein
MNGQVENVLMCRGRVDGNLPGGLPGSKGQGRQVCEARSRTKDKRRARACNLDGFARIARGTRSHETVSAQSVPKTLKAMRFQGRHHSLGSTWLMRFKH